MNSSTYWGNHPWWVLKNSSTYTVVQCRFCIWHWILISCILFKRHAFIGCMPMLSLKNTSLYGISIVSIKPLIKFQSNSHFLFKKKKSTYNTKLSNVANMNIVVSMFLRLILETEFLIQIRFLVIDLDGIKNNLNYMIALFN